VEHIEQEQLRRFWHEIVSAVEPTDPASAAALVVTHLLPDRPFFLDALAQIADIACVLPKPKSIDRTVLLRIRDHYDVEVLDRNALTDGQQLSALMSRHSIGARSLVAIDIGGYFAPAISQLAAEASLAGIVEDTENGHQRYERALRAPFPCPVFSVARSPLKNAEDYLIGHSVVFSTEGLMRSRGDVLQGRSACVIGYGKIGRSIAHLLRAHGVQISVHDINPVPLTEAHAHGFAVHSELSHALDGAGIVMCATGNLALRHQDFEHVQPGAYVASVTSSDHELELRPLKERYERNRVGRDIVRYRRRATHGANGHYFFVLNNGEAVNFLHGAVVGPAIYLVQAEVLMAVARLLQKAHAETSQILEITNSDRATIAAIWLSLFGRKGADHGTRTRPTDIGHLP
jgi:adenosylhomocysteinase